MSVICLAKGIRADFLIEPKSQAQRLFDFPPFNGNVSGPCLFVFMERNGNPMWGTSDCQAYPLHPLCELIGKSM